MVRKGETLDLDSLLAHLNTVGYASADVVEMPGEYAMRGGILDVYPPEADRPLRIELFGDEVESIRKFDPGTQRSSFETDEAVLLPLTESPVTEELLGAIHVRLSGKRVQGDEQALEEVTALRGRDGISRMGVFRSCCGRAEHDLRPDADCHGVTRRAGIAGARLRRMVGARDLRT